MPLLAVVAGLLGGCSSLPEGNARTLAVGAVLPLTGANAPAGQALQRGLELAVAEVNAAGGVHGRPLELGVLDSQSDLVTGAQAAKRWRDRAVPVLLLGDSVLAADLLDQDLPNAPQLVGFLCDYSPAVSLAPKNGVHLFLSSFAETRALSDYLVAAGAARVAILQENGYAWKSQAQYMDNFLQGAGIHAYQETYSPGESHFDLLADELRQEKCEALVLAGEGPEYATIAAAFAAAGWKGPVLGYFNQPSLAGLVPREDMLHRAVIYPVPAFVLNPRGTAAGRAFADKYRARYGADPDVFAALAYDNIRVLAAAAARAPSDDPAKLRAAWIALQTYDGAAGPYKIGDDGDATVPLQLVYASGLPAPPPAKLVPATTAPAGAEPSAPAPFPAPFVPAPAAPSRP